MAEVPVCGACGQVFKTVAALVQHVEAKHGLVQQASIADQLDGRRALEIVDDRKDHQIDDAKSDVLNPPPSDPPLPEEEGKEEVVAVEGKEAKEPPIEYAAHDVLIEHDRVEQVRAEDPNLEGKVEQLDWELENAEVERVAQNVLRERLRNQWELGMDAGVEAMEHKAVLDAEYNLAEIMSILPAFLGRIAWAEAFDVHEARHQAMLRLFSGFEPRHAWLGYCLVWFVSILGLFQEMFCKQRVQRFVSAIWCLLPIFLMMYIFMHLPTSRAQVCVEAFGAEPTPVSAIAPILITLSIFSLVFIVTKVVHWYNNLPTREQAKQQVTDMAKDGVRALAGAAGEMLVSASKSAEPCPDCVVLKERVTHLVNTNETTLAEIEDLKRDYARLVVQTTRQDPRPCVASNADSKEEKRVPPPIPPRPKSKGALAKPPKDLDNVAAWINDLWAIGYVVTVVWEAAVKFFSKKKNEKQVKESLQELAEVAAVGMAAPAFAQYGWAGVLDVMKWIFSSANAIRTFGQGILRIAGCVIELPVWLSAFEVPSLQTLLKGVKQSGFAGWFYDFYAHSRDYLSGKIPAKSEIARKVSEMQDLAHLQLLSNDYYIECANASSNASALQEAIAHHHEFDVLYHKLFDQTNTLGVPSQRQLEEQIRMRRAVLDDYVRPGVALWIERVLHVPKEKLEALRKPVHIMIIVAFLFAAAYLWYALAPKRKQKEHKESDLGKRGYAIALDEVDAKDFSVRDEERRMEAERVREEHDEQAIEQMEGADEGDMRRGRAKRVVPQAAPMAVLKPRHARARVTTSWADVADEDMDFSKPLEWKESETIADIQARKRAIREAADQALLALSAKEAELVQQVKLVAAAQDAKLSEEREVGRQRKELAEKVTTQRKLLADVRSEEQKLRDSLKVAMAPLERQVADLQAELMKQKELKKNDVKNIEVLPEETARVIEAATKESLIPCDVCLSVFTRLCHQDKRALVATMEKRCRKLTPALQRLLATCKFDSDHLHLGNCMEPNKNAIKQFVGYVNNNRAKIACPYGAKCLHGEGKCAWKCIARGVVAPAVKNLISVGGGEHYLPQKEVKESQVTTKSTSLPVTRFDASAYLQHTTGHCNATVIAHSAIIPCHTYDALIAKDDWKNAVLHWKNMKVSVAVCTVYRFADIDLVRVMLPATWQVPKFGMRPYLDVEIDEILHMPVWRHDVRGGVSQFEESGPNLGLSNDYGLYKFNTMNDDCGSPIISSVSGQPKIVGVHNVGRETSNGCIPFTEENWKKLMTTGNATAGRSLNP